MMQMLPWQLLLALLLLPCEFATAEISADPEGTALLAAAQEAVAEYHQGAESADNEIKVVYFHPANLQPLEQWKARLQRILTDVEKFYAEGFQRFSLADTVVRFERNDDEYLVHLVQGRLPVEQYSYDSGRPIQREMAQALRGKIDFQRSFVLAIHGLCQEKEGKYSFSAPYYGSGTQRSGLCHAADCPLLDPDLLSEKEKKIVYSEHYYRQRKQSFGVFNSWYLGGIAHELGHGLALPHDAGRPWERKQPGVSLMGGGNHHYRSQLHGGKTPSYLSLASALRLLSHPLVTQSDRERFAPVKTNLKEIKFSLKEGKTIIDGEVESNVPVYGMIAYLWRPGSWPGDPGKDHQSVTYPTLVDNGQFQLKLAEKRPGDYRLRLAALNANGASKNFDFHLILDESGQPNVSTLNSQWLVSRVEDAVLQGDPTAKKLTSAASIAAAPTPEVAAKLSILAEILNPPEPLDLASTTENSVYLSDAKWVSANVGWSQVARNHYDLKKDSRDNVFLQLGGKFYAKGLYAHAESTYEFDLTKRWSTFSAVIGLRDGAAAQGSAVFTVVGDGKQLYQSPILRSGNSETIELDISGIERLELHTRGGEGHVNHCWSIWCEPKLER